MESESSAVARKLQNFFVGDEDAAVHKKEEPGVIKNLLLLSLMGLAVLLTHVTLILVKWTKYLES
ncbi:MAG: hypothetical protein JWQ35_660 [Bacteriovoracaceae bacterium]|nr:hypothetical protein [Bacteriovoracaceae bacterium]